MILIARVCEILFSPQRSSFVCWQYGPTSEGGLRTPVRNHDQIAIVVAVKTDGTETETLKTFRCALTTISPR